MAFSLTRPQLTTLYVTKNMTMSKMVQEEMVRGINPKILDVLSKNKLCFTNGSEICFATNNKLEQCHGMTIDFLIVDEYPEDKEEFLKILSFSHYGKILCFGDKPKDQSLYFGSRTVKYVNNLTNVDQISKIESYVKSILETLQNKT